MWGLKYCSWNKILTLFKRKVISVKLDLRQIFGFLDLDRNFSDRDHRNIPITVYKFNTTFSKIVDTN